MLYHVWFLKYMGKHIPHACQGGTFVGIRRSDVDRKGIVPTVQKMLYSKVDQKYVFMPTLEGKMNTVVNQKANPWQSG